MLVGLLARDQLALLSVGMPCGSHAHCLLYVGVHAITVYTLDSEHYYIIVPVGWAPLVQPQSVQSHTIRA